MTHTLHRMADTYCHDSKTKDIVVLSMASGGHNREGANIKLTGIFRILNKYHPVNLADDNRGGVLTGLKPEEIIEQATDKAYMGAVFTDYATLRDVLSDIKKEDLGMSVVVSGEFNSIFPILKEIGLKPHTVSISLGVFGKKELIESDEILAITSMCGHGMVTPELVRELITQIRSGQTTAEEASLKMAEGCTCGIFNPGIAAEILKKITKKE
ncbi:MAG TPA: hypothetical protein PLV56_08925 [Synergistales bacterium]|nr:hypothetical protein [Synergistales bacterium]